MVELDKTSKRREATRAWCADRNLAIQGYGQGWWISGNGVSLIVADLAYVSERDLEPLQVSER